MGQQQLAEAFEQALKKRNLTQHAAHDRYGISRESLRKMAAGRPPDLEILERFARAIGEDVNKWRALAGYPADTSPWNPDTAFNSIVRELRTEYADVAASLSFEEVIAADATPEEVEKMARVLRERCEELRDAKGGGRGESAGGKGREGRAAPRGRPGVPRLCAA